MPDLLIASENPGKLVEIQAILEGLPVRLVSPRDLGPAAGRGRDRPDLR